jgi:hypothetical protein
MGKNVGWMNLEGAYQALNTLHQPVMITIETPEGNQTFEAPKRYPVSKEFLSSNLSNRSIIVKENPMFQDELKTSISNLTFTEDPGKDAYINFTQNLGFEIVPEIPSTMIDKQALFDYILARLNDGADEVKVNITDFYIPVQIPSTHADLNNKLTYANAKVDKEIILNVNNEKFTIPREVLTTMVDENSEIISENLAHWVNNDFANQFTTQNKSIHWRNPQTNQLIEYPNNGAFGWGIDLATTYQQIMDALNGASQKNEINVVLTGNVNANPRNITTFIHLNLYEQKVYLYIEGELKVEAYVITGGNHKGTATMPGFHTIQARVPGQTLKGVGLDGQPYAVWVDRWMPLMSEGGRVTGIGFHDRLLKESGMGNPNAWRTWMGSNGCINTQYEPMMRIFDLAYVGMAVFITGDLYRDSPGYYDKPVNLGTVLE